MISHENFGWICPMILARFTACILAGKERWLQQLVMITYHCCSKQDRNEK